MIRLTNLRGYPPHFESDRRRGRHNHISYANTSTACTATYHTIYLSPFSFVAWHGMEDLIISFLVTYPSGYMERREQGPAVGRRVSDGVAGVLIVFEMSIRIVSSLSSYLVGGFVCAVSSSERFFWFFPISCYPVPPFFSCFSER